MSDSRLILPISNKYLLKRYFVIDNGSYLEYSMNMSEKRKGEHMTAIRSIAFCVGWIITASIGLWAMAIYGAFFVIREMR